MIELVAAPEAVAAVARRGGALYVWPRKARCCGGAITLEAATEPPDRRFERVHAGTIDVYLAAGMPSPESLHLEVRRGGRVDAFWNGLAWVV